MFGKLKSSLMGLAFLAFALALDHHLFREKNMNKNTKWWLLATGLLALFSFLAGCASASRTTILSLPIPYRGMTICDESNRPVIILNPQVVGTTEEKYVLAHEREHVAQMRRLGCRQTLQRAMQDSTYRFNMEAGAYCVDFELRRADGWDPEQMLSVLLPYLQRNYRPGWSLEFIRSRLPCGAYHGQSP